MSVSAAQQMRRRCEEAMQYTLPGAALEWKGRRWTVAKRELLDGSVALTLRRGRRLFRIVVTLWTGGPDWFRTGFTPVSPPPLQKQLFAGATT